ncbi:hypothetical protein KFK09_014722 [Dendrobium nobile]|uniref:Dynamin GTPase domain-containing protein n=1 Tax=Dendrobium nobile TaxID=94219 RepID=A0A8T3B4R1_DENNO|nr:hypothetical protein KFK09_014722 [Dendrobium nobile]
MAEDTFAGSNAVPSPSQPATSGPIGSSVIPIVNKLQDIFAQLGSSSTIDLPQVAVVGSQSSGKSSGSSSGIEVSRINSQLVAVAKEHAAYGDVVESKAGQGEKLLNILTKYCEAFTSMIEGKNEELSTAELSGGVRIHYIFQSIFVKSLEEVDPCEDVSDEDIRMAIKNATGPKSALFVPEVPFEVLVRRQIGHLLDPSLQCAKFIYDELIKSSHHSLANELHRYPVLRKCMDEVIGKISYEKDFSQQKQ